MARILLLICVDIIYSVIINSTRQGKFLTSSVYLLFLGNENKNINKAWPLFSLQCFTEFSCSSSINNGALTDTNYKLFRHVFGVNANRRTISVHSKVSSFEFFDWTNDDFSLVNFRRSRFLLSNGFYVSFIRNHRVLVSKSQ